MRTSIVMAYCIRPLFAASLALAITFTLGCEEKSGGKAEDNPKPAAEATAEAAKAKEAAKAASAEAATQTACDEKIEAKPKTDKTAAAEAAAAKAAARLAAAQDALDEAEVDASAAETEEALAEASARLPALKATQAKAKVAFAKFSISTTSFTDSRDCKTYKSVKIGNATWMAENLNYKPSIGSSWCYDDKNSNCEKYGRLYDWTTALKTCPKGWHLPSKEEWTGLVESAGVESSGSGNRVGERFRARDGWADGNGVDLYGFSALPGGVYHEPGYVGSSSASYFSDTGTVGWWWTATEYNSDNAYTRRMHDMYHMDDSSGDKRKGLSVRCVKD